MAIDAAEEKRIEVHVVEGLIDLVKVRLHTHKMLNI
jgi:hypothetical protein